MRSTTDRHKAVSQHQKRTEQTHVSGPDVLLVMTDEHHADVAGLAGDPIVRTKCLDGLAERSIVVDRATCADPVCTPSRMSMLTVKEPHRCARRANHWTVFPEHATWPAHSTEPIPPGIDDGIIPQMFG